MASPNTITANHIAALIARSTITDTKMGEKTTVVCLKLPNGYEVIESSGCVDPANYNHAMGRGICLERIVNRVWQLEGYRLQSELAAGDVVNFPPGTFLAITDEGVARIAHEVNRAYCAAIGDPSQAPWAEAPEWQKQSAINGVKFHRANPEAQASASHENWMKDKLAEGWIYGPAKDPVAKQHPCMVPFGALPLTQQVKDHLFRAVVHALV